MGAKNSLYFGNGIIKNSNGDSRRAFHPVSPVFSKKSISSLFLDYSMFSEEKTLLLFFSLYPFLWGLSTYLSSFGQIFPLFCADFVRFGRWIILDNISNIW